MSQQRVAVPRSLTDMPYRVAGDPYWAAAGSTHLTGQHALPGRRGTRTQAGTPLNLSVYDLAGDHDNALREFAARHGDEEDVPAGRTALAQYAAGLAADNPEAEKDYQVQQLSAALRAALTIGDADGLLGKMTCPKCLGWTLVGVRSVTGAWRATCWNRRCASDPADGRPDDANSLADHPAESDGGRVVPRSWSLGRIARHHVYGPRTA